MADILLKISDYRSIGIELLLVANTSPFGKCMLSSVIPVKVIHQWDDEFDAMPLCRQNGIIYMLKSSFIEHAR